MLLPSSKVPDVPLTPDLAGPGLVRVHDIIVKADRAEDRLLLSELALKGTLDFSLHPFTGEGSRLPPCLLISHVSLPNKPQSYTLSIVA